MCSRQNGTAEAKRNAQTITGRHWLTPKLPKKLRPKTIHDRKTKNDRKPTIQGNAA